MSSAASASAQVKPDQRVGWRLYAGVLTPSLIVVALLSALAINSVNVLGAIRSYVGGESLWSKARSDAVQHLITYSATQNLDDYAAFEMALSVPLGDQQAREGLQRSSPDFDAVRQGFLRGGNHPEDIEGMIILYQRFGRLHALQDAFDAWDKGDALLAQLRLAGRKMRHQFSTPEGMLLVAATVDEVRAMNREFITTEKKFSASLGEVSRFTQRVLIVSTLSATVILTLVGVFLVRLALKGQMQHRHELEAANERWVLAAAASQLGLFEWLTQDNTIKLDAKAAELYGLDPVDVVLPRAQLRALVLEEERQTVGDIFKATFRVQRPDDSQCYLEATGHWVGFAQAGEERMVGVIRDVTEEREQALRLMQRDAAERVAQARREFLSRLSHELRTPLNAILGFAQLLTLDRAQPLTEQQSHRVNMVLNAGRQLLSMIEDVLDLTKVDAGEISISLAPVEVHQLWKDSVAMLDGMRERYEVQFVDQLPSQPLWVYADHQRLMQVFINLLSNACKYNRPGGHVTIDAHRDQSRLIIEFSDEGIGMSPDQVSQLFQPFKRMAPQSANIEGSGLGLYIVKQLIERMNGSIKVRSDSGQGSRFTITLPMAASAQAATGA